MERIPKSMAVFGIHQLKPKIDPSPPFQRGPVWSKPQKQLLMDTILRDLDIPKLYLRRVDRAPYEYEVVDGQQRLRAIWEFMNNEYALSPDADPVDGERVADALFKDLPADLSLKFTHYSLDVIELRQLDDEERDEMFLRLQNGTSLNAAEKRNALPGRMKDFVKELTNHKFFGNCVAFNNRRMGHDEVAAQITAIELAQGPCEVRDRSLRAMYLNNPSFNPNSREAQRIRRVLSFLEKAFRERTPELTKANCVSIYMVASHLLMRFAVAGKEADFGRWFVEFEAWRHADEEREADERDPDMVTYQERTVQGTGQKDSLEIRHRVLSVYFLLTHPDVEPLDPQRVFSDEQRRAVYRRDEGQCQMCKEEVAWGDFHVDHLIPHSQGGKTTVANAQLLCPTCNLKKGTRPE